MDDQNLKDLEREQADNKLIGDAFQHLLDTYLSSRHRKKVDIVTKAFNFARQAHKGVRRLSGEPYIMHPIAVAQIACEEMGLGSTSICAALLHDVVEDTDYTVEDISNIFGLKGGTDCGWTHKNQWWHLWRPGFCTGRKLQEVVAHHER